MLLHGLRVLYLHGFASAAHSRKARFFAENLEALNIRLEIPDLAEGEFHRLTVTRQLRLLERILSDQPAILIGSSLGGYLAALYASRHAEIERVILLAPAFDFERLWIDELGPERIQAWRETGSMRVFHYGEGCDMPLGFEFLEDAASWDPFPSFRQPALIFHGEQDTVVPMEHSVKFVGMHAAARLVRLHSGHELTDVLPAIWDQAQPFLCDRGPGKQVLD